LEILVFNCKLEKKLLKFWKSSQNFGNHKIQKKEKEKKPWKWGVLSGVPCSPNPHLLSKFALCHKGRIATACQ
jgi:hypothetical protein